MQDEYSSICKLKTIINSGDYSLQPVMRLELDGILVKDYILESNFLRDLRLKKNRYHLFDGLCRYCVGFDKIELYEEGALRVLKDVKISEIVESLR